MRAILFAALLALTACRPAFANDENCNLENFLPAVVAHENYDKHTMLSGDETRAALAVVTDGPAPATVRDGLLIYLKSGGLLLVVWKNNGTCGHALAPPQLGEKMLRAIKGEAA